MHSYKYKYMFSGIWDLIFRTSRRLNPLTWSSSAPQASSFACLTSSRLLLVQFRSVSDCLNPTLLLILRSSCDCSVHCHRFLDRRSVARKLTPAQRRVCDSNTGSSRAGDPILQQLMSSASGEHTHEYGTVA